LLSSSTRCPSSFPFLSLTLPAGISESFKILSLVCPLSFFLILRFSLTPLHLFHVYRYSQSFHEGKEVFVLLWKVVQYHF
jgi:hypothetical protein